ncbi:MAG: hypothetical protein AB7S26_00420 [Sandaracinaceae bacterium]
MRKVLSFAPMALLALSAFTFGCAPEVGNDGDVVGGHCHVSSECSPDSQCLTGERWPEGYCAKLCVSDADCPEGSACTQDGNFCLVSCASNADCREDHGYTCTARPGRGGVVGDVMVCARD